jgi:hypothetical protein
MACSHPRFEVQTRCADCGREVGRQEFSRAGLSQQEMQAQQGAELPDREQMSLVNADLAAPINAALAANILSDGSIAAAGATQTAPINQSLLSPPTNL